MGIFVGRSRIRFDFPFLNLKVLEGGTTCDQHTGVKGQQFESTNMVYVHAGPPYAIRHRDTLFFHLFGQLVTHPCYFLSVLMSLMSAREPFSVFCCFSDVFTGPEKLQKDNNLFHFDVLHNQHYRAIRGLVTRGVSKKVKHHISNDETSFLCVNMTFYHSLESCQLWHFERKYSSSAQFILKEELYDSMY